jgi:hypothetical protein
MPSADQSRWASSISLSDFEIPHRAAAALQPVVEEDTGDLAALAGAGTVAQHPAAPEAHGVLGIVGRGGDNVEGLVHDPRSGEMAGMRLARIDDGFELGIGQQAVALTTLAGRCGPIGGLGRRDRRHRGRLHEPRRMRPRAGDPDRLKVVSFIQRLGEAVFLGASTRRSRRRVRSPLVRAVVDVGRCRCGRCANIAARSDGRRRGRCAGAHACVPSIGKRGWNALADPLEQRGDIGRHAR